MNFKSDTNLDFTLIQYYEARKNAINMCKIRGYSVDDSLLLMSPLEFKTLYETSKNALHIVHGIKEKLDNGKLSDTDNVIIYLAFSPEEFKYAFKVAQQVFKKDDVELKELISNNMIKIISIQPSFDKVKKEVDENLPSTEFHLLKIMSKDILNHIYQPKITMLTNAERSAIFAKYGANATMFSTMCIDDPVNKYFGGQNNQMYRIESTNTDQGSISIRYRIVTSKRVNTGGKKSK